MDRNARIREEIRTFVMESSAAEQAKKQGLTYASFGRWKDKSGNIVAKSENGKLVPIGKDAEKTKDVKPTKQVDKKVDDVPTTKDIADPNVDADAYVRDIFLTHKGKLHASDVKRYFSKSKPAMNSLKSLADPKQYGGAYIKRQGDYLLWPEMFESVKKESALIKEGYSFDSAKKADWYKDPQMMGHTWSKETVTNIENVLNKYGSSKFQKYIISNVVNMNANTWHYFNQFSKKDLRLLGFVLKNSDKYTPFQLLQWVEKQAGMLKSPLNWALEYSAFLSNRPEYLKYYVNGWGALGMSKEDGIKRFMSYHKDIEKNIQHKEWAKK